MVTSDIENMIYYLLVSSADLLEGVAITSFTSDEVVTEMTNFKKVLKHHENSMFSSRRGDEIMCGSRHYVR